MALTAFTRFRFLWGAVDWQEGSDNPYAAAETGSLGTDANSGVGVRRVLLVIDRATNHAGADPAVMHFDILNMTGGNPDDTWTAGDYTNVETALDALWGSLKTKVSGNYKLTEYRYYRVGKGIVPPNPAVRTVTRSVAGTSAGNGIPPQVACSLTFRTAARKSWGRTYLPLGALATADLTAGLELSTTAVDALCGFLNTFVTALAANDFYLVVTSNAKSAALNVEKVEVDSNLDVVRRRRFKQSAYKKILP